MQHTHLTGSLRHPVLIQFVQFLRAQNYSERTLVDYERQCAKYFEFLKDQGLSGASSQDPLKAGLAQVRDFHLHLMQKKVKERPLHIGTVRKHLDAVKCFYRFLLATGQIHFDPVASYALPKPPKNLPRHILEEDEMLKLLNAPDTSSVIGLRDRAILELLYSTGLRNEELRLLELTNLDLKGRRLRLVGKGGKEAVLPFGRMASQALNEYLLKARPLLLKAKHGGPLKKRLKEGEFVFLSANGHGLLHTALTYMVTKYRLVAGIDKPITPHSIRHSFATHLLKAGADIRYIQRLLRHSSLDTTQVYTRVDVSDLKEVQKKFHPREQVQSEALENKKGEA